MNRTLKERQYQGEKERNMKVKSPFPLIDWKNYNGINRMDFLPTN